MTTRYRRFTTTHPRWAAGLRRAHRIETRIAYHWAFVAYALLTLTTAGYVIGELTPTV